MQNPDAKRLQPQFEPVSNSTIHHIPDAGSFVCMGNHYVSLYLATPCCTSYYCSNLLFPLTLCAAGQQSYVGSLQCCQTQLLIVHICVPGHNASIQLFFSSFVDFIAVCAHKYCKCWCCPLCEHLLWCFCVHTPCKSNSLSVDFPGSQGDSRPFCIQLRQQICLPAAEIRGTVTVLRQLDHKQPLYFSRQTSWDNDDFSHWGKIKGRWGR